MIETAKRFLSAVLPYRPMNGAREHLEAQYEQGTWEYLWSIDELGRSSVVAGYCRFLRPGGALLEVGCGEGILQDRLDRSAYSRYVGVDIALNAIRRATARLADRPHDPSGPDIRFVVADAVSFEPGGTFDVIIFNECLEYFEHPLSVMRRYERMLNDGGWFIASIFEGRETLRWKKIWRMINQRYRTYDATRVVHGTGLAWNIRVLDLPRGPQPR
jgi:2-polyprenyl-3-methyl-5-hydroxy-6-metoxy-1,4-benzoquinol methylase